MRGETTVHVRSHTPSADPLRRRVVGRLGECCTPDRSVRRSSTRRDQLVCLGVDVHRVLTVRQTVLVEGLVLDVVVCIAVRSSH